jgi:hypothetical protein
MAQSAAKLHSLNVTREREFPERNEFAAAQREMLKEKPDERSGAAKRSVIQ